MANRSIDWTHVGRSLAPSSRSNRITTTDGQWLDDAVFPLGAYSKNPGGGVLWALISLAGTAVSAYHGYKRNEVRNPVAWALWWGLWGAVIPIITVPIAVAQGFAEPAES